MDETTTGSPVVDTGVDASTQPSDTITIDEPAAQPQQTTETETTAEPSQDENSAWLQSKGIDKSQPDWEAKLIKNAREAEKLMSKRAEEAAKLQTALETPIAQPDQLIEQPDAVTQLTQTVEALKLKDAVKDFFAADGNTEVAAERKALEPAMADIVINNPAIGEMVKVGFMSYEQLAALAKGSNPDYATTLKQDGGREALETVAAKQLGKANPGAATTSALAGDTAGDPFLDGFNSI